MSLKNISDLDDEDDEAADSKKRPGGGGGSAIVGARRLSLLGWKPLLMSRKYGPKDKIENG